MLECNVPVDFSRGRFCIMRNEFAVADGDLSFFVAVSESNRDFFYVTFYGNFEDCCDFASHFLIGR